MQKKEPELRRYVGIGRLYPMSPASDKTGDQGSPPKDTAPTGPASTGATSTSATSEDTVIEDAVICCEGEIIRWVGPRRDAPALAEGERIEDLNGQMVTPGWIDPHTHLVWAGSRQGEFRQRIEGRSYLDIAHAGGGIMSTVREVRKASLEALIAGGRTRIQRLLSYGVTTAEVKSGYGLDTASEIKMLEAAAALHAEGPLELSLTFLGAHTVPTEFKQDRQTYVDLVCQEMIPEVVRRGLAESCDIFIEESAFSLAEARRILGTAQDAGLLLRVHADQLSAGGGAALAAELGAASADHLEEIDPPTIHKLARAGVTACLIPGSTFCLRQPKYAPARALLDAGVNVALSTDLNPGTTCSENLAMIGTMACVQMRMTPLEVLHALTRGAARSLKREHRIGSIAPGFQADLVVFNSPDIDYIFYHYGISHVAKVIKRGAVIWEQERDCTQSRGTER